jgi:hypothetical protein
MAGINVFATRNLVELEVSTFLSLEDARQQGEVLRSHFAAGRLKEGYLMMVNAAGAPIQAEDVVQEFRKQIAELPRVKELIVVAGRSPIRLQLRRVMQRFDSAVVDTKLEAMTRLFSRA